VKISKLYVRGLIFSFLGAYQDIFSSLFNLPKTEELIPFALVQSSGNLPDSLIISIDRINSFMTEPSEYAFFLVFGYICLDYLQGEKYVTYKTGFILKIHIIIFLLLTFSVSGIVLFFGYWIAKMLWEGFKKNSLMSLIKNIMSVLCIAMLLFSSIRLIPDLEVASSNLINRLTDLSLTSNNLNSSEGSRINSINLALDSFSDTYGLIGQGYGQNASTWISENHGAASVHYSRGDIFNTYASVTIAVGIPGFLFFLGTIYQAFINNVDNNIYRSIFLLVWVILGFALGSLLWYSYWGIFYLFATQGTSYKRYKHSIKC
jgi:hypothetical protein